MQAADHMALAAKYLEEARTTPKSMVLGTDSWEHRQLREAVKHINLARSLDPSARVIDADRPLTIDDLTFESLRIQTFIECCNGYNDKDVRRGIAAGETALKYRPYNIDVHMSLAMGHHRLLDKPSMNRHLDRVIEIDPQNIDAHNLRNNVTGRMPAENTSWFAFLKDMTISSPKQFFIVVGIPVFFAVCGWTIYEGFRDGNAYQWIGGFALLCSPGIVQALWDKVRDV